MVTETLYTLKAGAQATFECTYSQSLQQSRLSIFVGENVVRCLEGNQPSKVECLPTCGCPAPSNQFSPAAALRIE